MSVTDLAPAVVREPDVYRPDGDHSFFWDMLRAEHLRDDNATERLRRHKAQTEHRQREAEQQRLHAFRDSLGQHDLEATFEQRLNPNTSLGTGGEFAVPLWLIDRFASASRAGRPLGDLLQPLPLPRGVHSINVPRMTTGSLEGIQPAEGGGEVENDLVTTGVSSNVVTIDGGLVVSQQLQDQAPAGFDAYAYVDLKRAYNRALELQLISGTGGNGQLLGVTQVTGRNSDIDGTTFTSIQNLWPGLGKAASAVGNNRLLPPEMWLMAPRRWFWIASSVDNSQRPVASPGNTGPHTTDLDRAGGAYPVGPILGLPVYMDGAIPAGSNSDQAICLRPSDMLLWESDDKTIVTAQPTAGTLQVRIALYRYVAFLPHRYPTGITVITNLTQPTGF